MAVVGYAARFQLRLISCHVAGVLAEFITMPHFLAWGLEMRNVVLAWVLGVVLFLALAILGGLIWRRSIRARPVRWAVAAPAILMLAIYFLMRALSGFEPSEGRIALEATIVGGLCALFSSAFFLLWEAMAPGAAPADPSGAKPK